MPNIKSSIKRVRIARAKTLNNTAKKSALKTAVKKCKDSISKNDPSSAEMFKKASKALDKAAAKKIIHKNTAARKKSRLAKALNAVAK